MEDEVHYADQPVTATESLSNHGLDPARQAFHLRQHVLDFQAAISSLSLARQPVIAALHGMSLGLAVDIASACDVRLASTDVTFGIMVSQVLYSQSLLKW
jgi:enoyl-CoA hydratase/carnithine racemase